MKNNVLIWLAALVGFMAGWLLSPEASDVGARQIINPADMPPCEVVALAWPTPVGDEVVGYKPPMATPTASAHTYSPTPTASAPTEVVPPVVVPTENACKNKNSGKDGTPDECNAGKGQEK